MSKNVLRIGKPYLIQNSQENTTRLCALLSVSGQPDYTLWYETEACYTEYLCTERSDAFVVNLLLYAMEHELDIECEQAMSERLYYQLIEYLIPCVSKNIERYHAIHIEAPLCAGGVPNVGAVGASVSGGVDSFYTLLRHLNRKESAFNITHLTFFNAGASGEYGGEQARKRYKERIKWIQDVADELGKKIVCVDTNANEFLRQQHEATHTFRTLSIPLALQKLFSKYYFASGLPVASFCFDPYDTATYDLLNVQCLSTDALTFYLSGGESTRLEKLDYISNFAITYDKLNVCVSEATNCSRCEKCRRTMVGLYAMGKLERYAAVFDVPYFEKHRHAYLSDTVGNLEKYDWPEMYVKLKAEHNLGVMDYIEGIPKLLYQKVRKMLSSNSWARKVYYATKRAPKNTGSKQ